MKGKGRVISIIAICGALLSLGIAQALGSSPGSVTATDIATGAVGSRAIRDRSIEYVDISIRNRGDLEVQSLQSGRTEHGVIGGDFPAFATGPNTVCPNNCSWGAYATLPHPARAPLNDAHVLVNNLSWQNGGGQTKPVLANTLGNTNCHGTPTAPTAPAGFVCIYISGGDDAADVVGNSVIFGTGASPYGFKLHWVSTGVGDANNTFIDATWAYTAP